MTDLLIDPRTRGVTDVRHEVAAVASRSVDKARAFADGFGLSGANAYGSVEDLLADKVRPPAPLAAAREAPAADSCRSSRLRSVSTSST